MIAPQHTPAHPLPGVRLFDLTGRAAIVTGGSKGLGFAIAAGFASAGADVTIVSRHREEAQAAADDIARQFGHRAVAAQADVTIPDQVNAMVDAAIADFGRVDILVNSAGINIRGAIGELSYDQFQEVQRINVDGTWLCCRAVVPHMKAAGRGSIINLALELAPLGIVVNALCPGPFLTELNRPIAGTEEGRKFIVGATALERWGELPEIQGPALLLASDAGRYMVGSMLVVDGGWTAR